MLWNRMNRGAPKVRVFCERKDPQLLGPNIRYFVAKLSIVAIYALYGRPPKSFLRKSSYFESVFYESQLAFVGIHQKSARFLRAFRELS